MYELLLYDEFVLYMNFCFILQHVDSLLGNGP
jgi:hypothetical protein